MAAESYRCAACARQFPVLFGIPDLRLQGDRYLSLEAEREKAARVAAIAEAGAGFEELIDRYYAMTDDVPSALVPRFKHYVLSGPARARAPLAALGQAGEGLACLDVGCGSGGLLVAAAGRGSLAVGLDVALRWLVIARRRLEEAGLPALLVCADLGTVPFPHRVFDRVVAMDLLEHVDDIDTAFAALAAMTAPGGRLWLSASNARFPGPHPSLGLWAAGWRPPAWRRWALERRHGIDISRALSLLTPGRVREAAFRHGFVVLSHAPRTAIAGTEGRAGLEGVMLRLYARILRWSFLRPLLARAGPAFEMMLRKLD